MQTLGGIFNALTILVAPLKQGCASVKVVKSVSYFVEEIRKVNEVAPSTEEHPDGEGVNVEEIPVVESIPTMKETPWR